MGTRGAYGFYVDEQTQVTYNHFDSYPDGLGKNLAVQLAALMQEHDLPALREMARAVELIDEDVLPTKAQQEQLAPYCNLEVNRGRADDWYCLLRGLQGELGQILTDAKVLAPANEFLQDSLFCEWAYIANLDEGLFEIYEGFQTAEHDQGRYASDKEGPDSPPEEYFPVALIAKLPIDKDLAENFDKWHAEHQKEQEA